METALYSEHRAARLLGFVGLLYLMRLVGAALVALPIASALRATGVGQQPTGDAVLFAPGASYLFETLRLAAPALSGALPVSSALLVIAMMLQLVPQGALIHGLTQPAESLGTALQRSFSSFSRFLLLGGLGFMAQACVTAFGVIAAQSLRRAIGGVARAWPGELAFVLVVGLFALAACAIGALVDLARCRHAWSRASLASCINTALRTLSSHPLHCATAVLVPTLSVLTLGVLTGFITGALQIELGHTWRWLVVLILHQVVILGSCAAELYWLSRANRLVQKTLRPTASSAANYF